MRDVCIVGVGKLGGALAIALSNASWNVRELVVRSDRVAKKLKTKFIPAVHISSFDDVDEIAASIVLIAVDDPEIAFVAEKIAYKITETHTVFHTSGSLSSSILSALRERGAVIGSIHPLASVSDPFAGYDQFAGTYFCVEGDTPAELLGKRIVRSLGGIPFSIDSGAKPLYHAAAVTAAGHVTALFDAAVEMMRSAGLDQHVARKVLFPLIRSTAVNLEKLSPSDALTGTFSRLDIHTFERHLASFQDLPRNLVHLYLELGERSLDLVEQRDGPSNGLQDFRKAVSIAKQKYRC